MEKAKKPSEPGRVPSGVSPNPSSGKDEKRFRTLFDQLPLGATLVSPDFRFLKLNQAYCDIMGYSREELMSLTFADITHPEDLEADLTQAKLLLEGRIDRYEMEKRFIRKDGRIVWARLITGGIRDEQGRLVNFLSTLEDITQKKATEEALRESEARFRTSLEILPECFAILKAVRDDQGRTVDFRCEYLNEGALRMTGLRREDAIGRDLVGMFPELKVSILLSGLLRTLEKGRQLVRDGVEFPEDFAIGSFSGRAFDVRAARLGDGVVVAWADVTDRRDSAKALRRKAEEVETLLESVPALVFIAHDPEGRHITGNRAAIDFLGIPKGGEVSLNTPPEKRPGYVTKKDGRVLGVEELPMQQAARGNVISGAEYDIELPDGTTRHVVANVTPLYDEKGKPRGAVGSFVDLTERKRMENALRESERRLRALVKATSDVMYIMSPDWGEMYRLSGDGDPSRALEPQPDWLQKNILPDDQARFKALIREAIRAKGPFELEHPVRSLDSFPRWVLIRAVPLLDAEGNIIEWFGSAGDITDRKRYEEALKAALAEKENLLRELSHRTKNNMQVIESLLGLQASKSGDARLSGMLTEARNRIRAMALVHERLYKSGSATALSMDGYIRDLVYSLLDAQQEAPGAVRPAMDLEGVVLSLDAAVPCGLIINELVSNSLKHAFAEKKLGTIFLSLRRDAGEVELRYGDDGPGLPRDLELFQVESLGLKLVYNLAVRQLRGKMELRSDPHSEFVFRFKDLDVAKRL